MGLWRRQTGLFHWATSSSSPKHEARLGLAAEAEMSAVPTVHSDKRMIKIKAGHRAPNTQLWWQRKDNGQRERRKTLWGGLGRLPVSHKVYFLYWAMILYIQLYPGEECHLFTVHKCTVFTSKPTTDQFVTVKYVWQALVREHSVSLREHVSYVTTMDHLLNMQCFSGFVALQWWSLKGKLLC